jgi:hypothetical protein
MWRPCRHLERWSALPSTGGRLLAVGAFQDALKRRTVRPDRIEPSEARRSIAESPRRATSALPILTRRVKARPPPRPPRATLPRKQETADCGLLNQSAVRRAPPFDEERDRFDEERDRLDEERDRFDEERDRLDEERDRFDEERDRLDE